MPTALIGRITYGVFTVICLLALWKGDRWKRIAGAILMAAVIVTPLVQDQLHLMDPQGRLLLIDLALLAALGALVIHVGRTWMIFCTAFQLDAVLTHPAAHLFKMIGPLAYLTLLQVFSYGCYLTLGVAVLLSLRRPFPESDLLPTQPFARNSA